MDNNMPVNKKWIERLMKTKTTKSFKPTLDESGGQIVSDLHTGNYFLSAEKQDDDFAIRLRTIFPKRNYLWLVEMKMSATRKLENGMEETKTITFDIDNKQTEVLWKCFKMEEIQQFVDKDDQLPTLTIEIEILSHVGLPNAMTIRDNILKTLESSDVTLKVGSQQLAVNKSILMENSSLFNKKFNQTTDFVENESNVIDITMIEHREIFSKFIGLMYGFIPKYDLFTCDYLFYLCDRFEALPVRNKLENSIRDLENEHLIPCLLLAEKNNLKKLEENVINSIETLQQMEAITCCEGFGFLKPSTQEHFVNTVLSRIAQ